MADATSGYLTAWRAGVIAMAVFVADLTLPVVNDEFATLLLRLAASSVNRLLLRRVNP